MLFQVIYSMLLDTVLFFAGLAVLYYGAEYLVKGAASTAVILGVRPIIVGLTVVAFGTSMPELVASIIAVLRGSNDIALGNVVGSNIGNVGLVMGIGALIYPIEINPLTVRRDLPFMLVITFLLMALSFDGVISRGDGVALLAGVLLFTGYCVLRAVRFEADERMLEKKAEEEGIYVANNLLRELGVTALGVIGVMVGAYLLVESAASIARNLGISELVIGVTIVAIGTSLPELATTAVAAFRRHSDIAVGNIIGSNIFNIGLILGATSMVHPLPVGRETYTREMIVMTAFSLALIPMTLRLKVGRLAGAFLLAGYAAFIVWVAFFRMG